jgi:hypothetical protein
MSNYTPPQQPRSLFSSPCSHCRLLKPLFVNLEGAYFVFSCELVHKRANKSRVTPEELPYHVVCGANGLAGELSLHFDTPVRFNGAKFAVRIR